MTAQKPTQGMLVLYFVSLFREDSKLNIGSNINIIWVHFEGVVTIPSFIRHVTMINFQNLVSAMLLTIVKVCC